MKKSIFLLLLVVTVFLLGFYFPVESVYEKYLGYKYDNFWSDKKSPHRLVNNILARRSNVTWASGNHTSEPVPIGSIGPEKYTSQLKGVIQNTKIAQVTKEAVNDGISVIIVIGDGLGYSHMSLPIFKQVAARSDSITYFEKILNNGETGIVLTNVYDALVTGSAAAGSAIAGGEKSHIYMLGKNHKGEDQKTVLDFAENQGMSTGLVTRASLLDATPAAFYGHANHRHQFDTIAVQLVYENDIEILYGGGATYFIPKGKKLKDFEVFNNLDDSHNGKSKRSDNLNLLKKLEEKNYKIICNKDQLKTTEESNEKVIGLFSAWGLNATIDSLQREKTNEPSLLDMSKSAINKLSSNSKGFFLMIEAARIDWEAHDNDIGAVAYSMDEMDLVLKEGYKYYSKNPEKTLLIFTSDHETGGLAISYAPFENGYSIKKKLENGYQWESGLNNLPFENYSKLYEQKRTYYSIFKEAKSSKELFKLLNENIQYEFTEKEVDMIYSVLENYEKSK